MGSLGDKFKKLAGDQTRQLLQNFQNAQSSKTRNGYSYGKLNEDGTATLADGTTVQVEVKGRPGQYAPVFNLGNGQGLVDQPEAKFFNIDSSGTLRYYAVFVTIEQQYPNSFYEGQIVNSFPDGFQALYYFNYFTATNIKLVDLISQKSYNFDPPLLAGIEDLPLPFFQQVNTGSFRSEVFTSGPLSSIIDANDAFSRMQFSYSNVRVQISTSGKDILLYQVSNRAINGQLNGYTVSGADPTPTLIETANYSSGDFFLRYWILKDYYFEEDLLKCNDVTSGVYSGIDLPDLSASVSSSYTSNSGEESDFEYTDVLYVPSLSRDQNGNITLDLLVLVSRYEFVSTAIFHPGNPGVTNSSFTGVRTSSLGNTSYMVKNINSDPYISWRDTPSIGGSIRSRLFKGYQNNYYETFKGLFYGTLVKHHSPEAIIQDRCDTSTLEPIEPLGTFAGGYISKNFFYSYPNYVPGILESMSLPPNTPVMSPTHCTQFAYGTPVFSQSLYAQQPPPYWDYTPANYPVPLGSHYSSDSWVSAIPSFVSGSTNTSAGLRFFKVTISSDNTLKGTLFSSRYDIPEGLISLYAPPKVIYTLPGDGILVPDMTYTFPWIPTSFMAFQS